MKQKANPTCEQIGCNNKATHKIMLELRSLPNTPPVKSRTLFVCDNHCDVQFNDIVSSQMFWMEICTYFKRLKLAIPVKKYSTITIKKK